MTLSREKQVLTAARLSALAVPPPVPTGETRHFWDACARGRFELQHCAGCERWVFYPRAQCPHCWSQDLRWREASGKATVRSFTVVHKPGHPGWADAAPYVVAVLVLAEGPTMLTTLRDVAPADVAVGMPVRISFTPVGEYTLPTAVPAGEPR
ncbi:Zn-ribbon domain-containing OB-fold protein [Kocuria nitroreducens]|uniref:Zn-ribbon domain-containing OB-fold protein n=1 Tax=Kocuria nitroreducens TaxID=3058914 RepID=UPI0036DEC9FA